MQKLKAITIVSLFLFSLLFVVFNVSHVEAVGTTRYVATTGNDATGDGSISNPFKTLSRANNASTSGDTIYIRGGTYYPTSCQRLNKNGLSTAWITYTAYPGENVIIDGRNTPGAGSTDAVIQIRDANYTRVTGINISNAARSAIHIYYRDNYIRIDNCSIFNTSQRGIIASPETSGLDINHVTVEHNFLNWTNNHWNANSGGETISFSGVTVKNFDINNNYLSRTCKESIDVKNGANNGTIHHNIINCTQVKSLGSAGWAGGSPWQNGRGIYADGYSYTDSNISIYNNFVWGNQTTIDIGAELGGSIRDISVYNNVINPSGTAHGITISTNPLNIKFKNIYIYSNTVYSSGLGNAFRNTQYKERLQNLVVKNNIFQTASYYTIYQNHLNVTDGVTTITNNLYYRATGVGHNIWTATEDPANGWGTSQVLANPLFVNKNTGNFHLNSTSPAIDVGSSLYVPSVDYDGNTRPKGLGYDIGAYEAGPNSITITSDSGFNISNGVRYGSGTSASPYMISNWTVYNVSVSGTTKNFTIRDCTIIHHVIISGLSASSNLLWYNVVMDGVGHIPLSYIYLTHTLTTFTNSKFYNLSYSYMKNG
jgi:hypothetical protein